MLTVVTFQLSSSQGGWLLCPILPLPCTYFNSQPHKEADFFYVGKFTSDQQFQLTASQGGWRIKSSSHILNKVFQLTASQGGWLTTDIRLLSLQVISTHSLTRRLTSLTSNTDNSFTFQLTASQGGWHETGSLSTSFFHHFNSQPHKEADLQSHMEWVVQRYFNSQPHKEADLEAGASARTLAISTHSLTRRLTKTVLKLLKCYNISTHSLTRRLT